MAYPPFHPDSDKPAPPAMSEAELAQAFPSESEVVERKTGVSGKAIQETVVAFSNGRGGVILIGVQDDGTVVGRDLSPGLADDLHRILREVNGAGRYEIHRLGVDEKSITVLAIARRIEGFAQTSDGRVLVRRGTRNDAPLGSELTKLLKERALERFEATALELALDDVAPTRLAAMAERFGWPKGGDHADRLVEQGLVAPGGRRRLTVAGALCLTEKPHETLGKAFIEIFRFPEGAEDYDRRVEVTGPVNEQVERAAELIADELGSESVVLGVRRHELPRLPRRVLREAIANAVAHRDYEQGGRCIRVELRSDAMRIVSPGALPEPVTEQNIRETQSARNQRVLRVLRRFDLAEDFGKGVDVIQDLMSDAMLDPPRFHDTGHSVEVTLPIRSTVTPAERAWVREIEQRGLIEPADRILLVHAARGNLLTNAEARELLSVDALAARSALHRLRDAGFLVQRGTRAGTTYVLKSSLAPPAGLRLGDDELRDLVLEIAREGEPLTNARVRERTGLDRAEALRILDSLVQQRQLRRIGERRGTRYVLEDT